METVVTIKNCRLHIVRRGGWGWGASRKELTDKAVRLLPELIATRLAAILPGDHDLQITAPLKIDVSLTRQQLLDAMNGQAADLAASSLPLQALNQRVDEAIRRSSLPCTSPATSSPETLGPQQRARTAEPHHTEGGAETVSAPGLLRLLIAWQRRGELGLYLRQFSLATLDAWHRALAAIESALGLTPTDDNGQLRAAPADSESAIAAPLSEIDAVVEQIARFFDAGRDDLATVLRGRIVAAVEAASRLGAAPGDPRVQDALNRKLPVPAGPSTATLGPNLTSPSSILAEIKRLQLQGGLAAYLRGLSPTELAAWHAVLVDLKSESDLKASDAASSPPPGRNEEQSAPPLAAKTAARIDAVAAQVVSEMTFDPNQPTDILRCRIAAAAMLAEQLAIPPGDPRVQAAVNHRFPLKGDASDWRSSVKPADPSRASSLGNGPIASLRLARRWDVQVESALPFLLLGTMADTGYLETVHAALDAAGLSQLAPAFATALAYKVLEPPARGWRRSSACRTAAAAFAGVAEPVPDPLLDRLAASAGKFVSALNAVLGRAIVKGHPPDQPFLVCRAPTSSGEQLWLTDVDGVFPVSLAETAGELLDSLRDNDSELLLVEGQAAQPELLREVHEKGFRFLTDVPPTRGESWRAVRGPRGRRWWTNDAASPDSRLVRCGSQLSAACESALSVYDELHIQRPAVPSSGDPALDQALSLAAAVCLGQIAWALWHDREPTDPTLALERFADLGASVHFDEQKVRVVLPLGRRSMDLTEHGLLRDVADVPWLGGRIVTFGKG